MLRPAVLSVALLAAAPSMATDIVGRAATVDGDTLEIHGARIRLDGVDAPESRQVCRNADGQKYRCGQAAANALAEFLSKSQPIRCQPTGQSYERIVAVCWRADGVEVSRWLVASGWAVDWPRYSKGRYAGEQEAARADRLGIWGDRFEMPCAFRGKTC